jgi:hypothetical protein
VLKLLQATALFGAIAKRDMTDNSTLIYLDTNSYSRPFDDQTQTDIQAEANAFLEIIAEVKGGKLLLLGSDILDFEVYKQVRESNQAS